MFKSNSYDFVGFTREDVLLVHDVAEEQHRLDHDEDCKMNGGQAGRHRGNLGALNRLLGRVLRAKGVGSAVLWSVLLAALSDIKRSDPNLSAALNQVLHVPFDRVQVLLDVVEVLHGLVRAHAAPRALVLGRADLFHRLVKGVPAATKETFNAEDEETPDRRWLCPLRASFFFCLLPNM